jgi:hypothetical protein
VWVQPADKGEREEVHEWRGAHELSLAKALFSKLHRCSNENSDSVSSLRASPVFLFLRQEKYLQEEANEDV